MQHGHLFRVGYTRDGMFHELPTLQPSAGARARQLGSAPLRHSVTVEERGVRVSLKYTATPHARHTLPLLSPSLAMLIVSITCNSTHLMIHPRAGAAERLALSLGSRFEPGALVTGACEAAANAVPFYRTTRTMHAAPGGDVVFATENASLPDAFDTLSMDFTHRPQQQQQHNEATRGSTEEAAEQLHSDDGTHHGRRRLFLTKIGKSLNDLGEA
eukprot:7042827-Prymnesium_polylepis.1